MKIAILTIISLAIGFNAFAQENQYLKKGRELLAAEDFKQAYREATKCINTAPKMSVKAQCYILRADSQQDSRLRRADINSAVKLAPNSDEVYTALGRILLGGEDYVNSEPAFLKALKLNPNNAEARFFMGQVYAESGKPEKAVKSYGEAIRLKYNLNSVYLLRGEVYLESLYEYDQAISDFTKYIELEPMDIDGYRARGNAFQRKGDKEKARADFEMMLKIDSDSNSAKELLNELNLTKDEFLKKGSQLFEEGNSRATLAFLLSYPEFAGDAKTIELLTKTYQDLGNI